MNSSNEVSVELRKCICGGNSYEKKSRNEKSGENILILDIFCVIFSLGRGKREKKIGKIQTNFS